MRESCCRRSRMAASPSRSGGFLEGSSGIEAIRNARCGAGGLVRAVALVVLGLVPTRRRLLSPGHATRSYFTGTGTSASFSIPSARSCSSTTSPTTAEVAALAAALSMPWSWSGSVDPHLDFRPGDPEACTSGDDHGAWVFLYHSVPPPEYQGAIGHSRCRAQTVSGASISFPWRFRRSCS